MTRRYFKDSLLGWEIDPADLSVEQSLGTGASGEVFKGTYLNQTVAIKMLYLRGNPEKETEEFIKEFSILVNVKSPYIVKFYGASLSHKLCMVMEYCEYGSLYNVLHDPEVEWHWNFSFQVVSEIIKGIQALHHNDPPIIHRDLKTLNVVVTEEKHCKLADFGLSRFDTSTNLDSLKKFKGTYEYIAPEAYFNHRSTKYSDIYSVGIIMWEIFNTCVKGRYERPYAEFKNYRTLGFSILVNTALKKVRPTLPTLPEKLGTLIQLCWHQSRSARPEIGVVLEKIDEIQEQYINNKDEWNGFRQKII